MKNEISVFYDILGKDIRSHLFQDELKDSFLLTKQMGIYYYGKGVIQCFCWHRKTYLWLKKTGVIFNDICTDDQIYAFRTDLQNLPLIFSMEGFFDVQIRMADGSMTRFQDSAMKSTPEKLTLRTLDDHEKEHKNKTQPLSNRGGL